MPFVLPSTTQHGSRQWLDPEVEEVVRILHHGDPTVGWSGDERLGLYLATDGPYAGQWELIRFPEDGSREHIVARSQPGVDLRTLPAHLAYHDMRRRNAVNLENEIAKAERAVAAKEKADLGVAVDTWLSRATKRTGPAPARTS